MSRLDLDFQDKVGSCIMPGLGIIVGSRVGVGMI